MAIIVALFFGATVFAQQNEDLQLADDNFSFFQRNYAIGVRSAAVYDSLMVAYKTYNQILTDNQEEEGAIDGMRRIYPYMIDGAIFFSQQGSNEIAYEYAVAYINIPNMAVFCNERFGRDEYYPTICYFAATTAYNGRRFKEAVKWFRCYIDTGEQENRENAYIYMTKAYIFDGNVKGQFAATDELLTQYPNNINLIYEAINAAIERKDNATMEKYVDAALALIPGDPKVLPLKGRLLADRNAYAEAMPVFQILYNRTPKDINTRRRYAQVAYNHAALIINDANAIKDAKAYKAKRQEATASLKIAEDLFEGLLAESPNEISYLTGLADTYRCQNRNAKKIISKIESLGGTYVASNVRSLKSKDEADNQVAEEKSSTTSDKKIQKLADTPSFIAFAKNSVEADINKWQLKDDYETLAEYQNRVNEKTRTERVNRLLKELQKDYVAKYADGICMDNLRLEKYDAENGVFLITSPYIGNLLLPVPRANSEARDFEAKWSKVKTDDAKFCVANDKLALEQLSFILPDGKEYMYTIDASLTYQNSKFNYNFDELNISQIAQVSDNSRRKGGRIVNSQIDIGHSDIDTNIPTVGVVNDNLFVVIISNENYRRETKVQFANNDGVSFREYCLKTLGCPEKNVHHVSNATLNDINAELDWMQTVAHAYGGQAKLMFYYAGHGVPDEKTKSAFLLPIDGYGSNINTGYSLDKLYETLGSVPAQQVVVFLDACFSGSQRDGTVIASAARGVAIKAKKSEPKGNMVVFSAATGSESAYPYKEKLHGLFTYYLLKKLQETKGNASMGEIVDYVRGEVSKKSIVENNKSQTPTCSAASVLSDQWREWRLAEPVMTEEEPE